MNVDPSLALGVLALLSSFAYAVGRRHGWRSGEQAFAPDAEELPPARTRTVGGFALISPAPLTYNGAAWLLYTRRGGGRAFVSLDRIRGADSFAADSAPPFIAIDVAGEVEPILAEGVLEELLEVLAGAPLVRGLLRPPAEVREALEELAGNSAGVEPPERPGPFLHGIPPAAVLVEQIATEEVYRRLTSPPTPGQGNGAPPPVGLFFTHDGEPLGSVPPSPRLELELHRAGAYRGRLEVPAVPIAVEVVGGEFSRMGGGLNVAVSPDSGSDPEQYAAWFSAIGASDGPPPKGEREALVLRWESEGRPRPEPLEPGVVWAVLTDDQGQPAELGDGARVTLFYTPPPEFPPELLSPAPADPKEPTQ